MALPDMRPKKVEALILGGGIHGVGVLHDLACRGWKDVLLLERSALGSGTSSRSTKLIHGGLRYLQRISQVGMVSQSLNERGFLLDIAPDIVFPLEILIPLAKGSGPFFPSKVRVGLSLYDFIAGRHKIHTHRTIPKAELAEKVPCLDSIMFRGALSFWDAQTDDLALVRRVAKSALKMGGQIAEHCEAIKLESDQEVGWSVTVRTEDGERIIRTPYVINCLGPWSNLFIEKSGLEPPYKGVSNKGTHIILKDLGLTAGLFLRAKEDKRMVFVLPWQGYTLVGTTESRYDGHPDALKVEENEVDYLLKVCGGALKKNLSLQRSDVLSAFSGLRWLAVEKRKSLTATSRETVLGENFANGFEETKRGVMITVYGGKLTSYRALAEKIGDHLAQYCGDFYQSSTHKIESWIQSDEDPLPPPSVIQRFL
ncbi:MAG: glycerol-3-phosphate dehydrogenase/oxidase [Oligoflexales bacterium]|nr:glycerol-3-phosphate dehydrogenase/oxidase [Oligoflexales bacterium]